MNVLCVFARTPVPGRGKSRLRARLGDPATDRLTAAFASDVLAWADSSADLLLVAHEGARELLPPCPAGAAFVPQVDGDFGERVTAAFDDAFARGASRVVMVGTDCPSLPAAMLDAAFAGLASAASTLITADDGGWIALGLTWPLGVALNGVAWSTAATAEQTAAALAADGRPPLHIGTWYDVDEAADLERLRADPHAAERAPRSLASIADVNIAVR